MSPIAPRGISATAFVKRWRMAHRGLLTGVVEADETFIGGVYDKRRKRSKYGKQPVFGALQRNAEGVPSKVRVFPVRKTNTQVLTAAVQGTVSTGARLVVTDENYGYRPLGKQWQHETVNHIALEYVRKGDPRSIHVNSIESFWSLFKRGVIGSYHKVSVKHLRRYLDEFSFRFNNRAAEDLFSLVMLNLVIASGIKYAELISQEEPEAAQPLESARAFLGVIEIKNSAKFTIPISSVSTNPAPR